jgi:hypothetical protein
MKPSIRKTDGRWVLTRPSFGFATSDEVTLHESWREACAALRSAPAGGVGSERGVYTLTSPGQAGWPRRGTIRMEDT